MSKKMKLPFTLKAKENAAAAAVSSPWLWPTCVNNPRTFSFRSSSNESPYKITNEDHHDRNTIEFIDTPGTSLFSATVSLNPEISINGTLQNPNEDNDASAVIQGLKSSRLFFEPGETSSILEEAKTHVFPRAKILAMDSRDPFTDFRVSMEEMVEAHGLKDDWDCLEELLSYYLRVNCKSNHGYIVGAFVDLLLHLQHLAVSAKVSSSSAIRKRCSSSTTATQCSFTSHMSVPSSSCSSVSPCLSSLENED
ncbi:Ovate family protein 13 [Dorcoceras hygrometricum]|uniref:Transcription repressor n=1 Tax=Dorcoceras hygrometricum TaxID=472368 RepID=A0A2Z7CPG1_9LAMI|nr:Ovate family protein 13 [Dorcoceras hygrometricum]